MSAGSHTIIIIIQFRLRDTRVRVTEDLLRENNRLNDSMMHVHDFGV